MDILAIIFPIFQDSLGKQCWVVLGRVLSTVRSDPAQLVTALRIVERETRYHLLCIIFYFFGSTYLFSTVIS